MTYCVSLQLRPGGAQNLAGHRYGKDVGRVGAADPTPNLATLQELEATLPQSGDESSGSISEEKILLKQGKGDSFHYCTFTEHKPHHHIAFSSEQHICRRSVWHTFRRMAPGVTRLCSRRGGCGLIQRFLSSRSPPGLGLH